MPSIDENGVGPCNHRLGEDGKCEFCGKQSPLTELMKKLDPADALPSRNDPIEQRIDNLIREFAAYRKSLKP